MTKLENKTKEAELTIDKKTLQDYVTFFTTKKGADMLPYAYLEATDNYNNLVKNCPDYYLFNDEVKTISSNKDALKEYLKEVTDIVEIGPGSDYTLEHKTLPILSYVENLKRYHAIDISKDYLDNACNYIKKHTPNIEICAVEADLMQKTQIGLNQIPCGKKAVLFLGSTLGNFTQIQQNYVLKQISKLTKPEDIAIITVDTNQDKESMVRAYDNLQVYNFMFGILKYFATTNIVFKPFINSFEVKCKWDEENKLMDICFVVKNDLSFFMESYGEIVLTKGQELRGITSRKPNTEDICTLIQQNQFEVLDILHYTNKMQLFICKRN